jgi:hypothetical protein
MPTPPSLPSIPSEQDLYDRLMAPIEPDLTSTSRPQLKARYRTERPEQREARKQRYAEAFRKFYQALNEYIGETVHSFKGISRDYLRIAESHCQEIESNRLNQFFLPPSS